MKKQIKSVSIFSVKGIVTVAILGTMLFGFEANASNKPSLTIKAVKAETKSGNEIESLMNSTIEANFVAAQYNADEFVKAELELEVESRTNSEAEADFEAAPYNAADYVEADMALETEGWLCSNDVTDNEAVHYDAGKYAKADLAREIESWMNNSSF